MNCEQAETILHAYFDNELDARGSAEFEHHLGQCPACARTLESLTSLRSSMNSAQLFEKTPAALRNRVLADIHFATAIPKTPANAPRRAPLSWLAIAAAVMLFAYTGWRVASDHRGAGEEQILAAAVVDAHLRSLQPGHLTDVLSTDQHTVKPWFDGKMDFAPPVNDFAGQGFPLQGGRLDVVHGSSAAALIYGRHKHLVNVFVWPTNEQDRSPRAGTLQGYQWINWRKNGMEFYAVSDVASPDLEQLQRLLAQ